MIEEEGSGKLLKFSITKEMEEGKEAMRTFGDLLQFHRKKLEPKAEPDSAPTDSPQESNSHAGEQTAS